MSAYDDYIDERTSAARACMRDLGCQPVLFLGSGLAQRYAEGPSWSALLEQAVKINPLIQDEFAYLLQKYGDLAAVGQALIDPFHSYAWSKDGRKNFPSDLFNAATGKDEYLKFAIAALIEKGVPTNAIEALPKDLAAEVDLIRGIRPNSIITTNYDTLAEQVFPEYEPLVGQTIIRSPSAMIGEIFKIHGCISEPSTLILTSDDYDGWCQKKKYLSAKLLTFFLEHPLLIVGYAAQDENVISILRDIDEVLASKGDLVSNIFYVVHDSTLTDASIPPREAVLDLRDGKSMRVNCMHASDFSWIYRAFAASEGLQNVNPKILRALVARTYELVRHDIPKMTIEVNFETLEGAVKQEDMLPRLLGITGLSDPDTFNATYPYLTTALGVKLGYASWHGARALVNKIKDEKGIDLCASDNQFHIAVKSGTNSTIHKYSEAALDLLKAVRDGVAYQVSLKKKIEKKLERKTPGAK